MLVNPDRERLTLGIGISKIFGIEIEKCSGSRATLFNYLYLFLVLRQSNDGDVNRKYIYVHMYYYLIYIVKFIISKL
jgi:hypothetical protein